MIAPAEETSFPPPHVSAPTATLWGLTPTALHDRLWASVGVTVVRQGCGADIASASGAGALFMLAAPHALVSLDAPAAVCRHVRRGPRRVTALRLAGDRIGRFVERVVAGPGGEFQRFERDYGGLRRHHGTCVMTADAELARRWATAAIEPGVWRWLRARVSPRQWTVRPADGRTYDARRPQDVTAFVRTAPAVWPRPDRAVDGLVWHQVAGVCAAAGAKVDPGSVVAGPAWVGANRTVRADEALVGPVVLWDAPAEGAAARHRFADAADRFADARHAAPAHAGRSAPPGKRAFDIAFAVLSLLITLPLYPLIMVAIYAGDGRPFFFGHRREGRGGREFRCWKFRSMRRDADRMQAQLRDANEADGPQFFMRNDPRLTRVGAWLRRLNLDELPQFWNVLVGDMSVVGPRPSPRAENRCCPAWREARLSVRPGITGLWQVKRTRRPGTDFQEWVRYDIEYVDAAGWRTDLLIILRTIECLLRRGGR